MRSIPTHSLVDASVAGQTSTRANRSALRSGGSPDLSLFDIVSVAGGRTAGDVAAADVVGRSGRGLGAGRDRTESACPAGDKGADAQDGGGSGRDGAGWSTVGDTPVTNAPSHLGNLRRQRFRQPRDQRTHGRKSGVIKKQASARAEARTLRGQAREVARGITTLPRVRECGKPFPHGVAFKQGAGAVSVAGVSTCGSVWACAVCAQRIAVKRAMDLGRGIARWVAAGNSVLMVTFTVSHQRTDSLESVWAALLAAQRRVVTGRAWQADQTEFAIRGWHRTTECTLTWKNGWHLHFHTLYFIEGEAPDSRRSAALKASLYTRWNGGLRAKGFSAGWDHAVDIRPMAVDNTESIDGDIERALRENPSLATYLAKSGARAAAQLADGRKLALEALAHTGKSSRKGFTPFGVLGAIGELEANRATDERLGIESSDALLDSLRWFRARWREWERFSLNRRQVTMSRRDPRSGKPGLAELLGLRSAQIDDIELAADDESAESAEIVAVLSASDTRRLLKTGDSPESVAAVMELHGVQSAVSWCADRGLELLTDIGSLELWEFEESRFRRAADTLGP